MRSARVGLGHDLHRLEPGGPLALGGLVIPCDVSSAGHSDGDALLHALTDALLGALGEGDIGELFPPTEPRWKGAASEQFLAEALRRMRLRALHVVNVDTIVITETPRLDSWKGRLRARLAELLGIDESRVGVKAKSAEGLGPIGEGRALEARAVVLLSGVSDA
jgi:2-C-methyl-D-erythritol 2,4-cyclodiphosphate synthase